MFVSNIRDGGRVIILTNVHTLKGLDCFMVLARAEVMKNLSIVAWRAYIHDFPIISLIMASSINGPLQNTNAKYFSSTQYFHNSSIQLKTL